MELLASTPLITESEEGHARSTDIKGDYSNPYLGMDGPDKRDTLGNRE